MVKESVLRSKMGSMDVVRWLELRKRSSERSGIGGER